MKRKPLIRDLACGGSTHFIYIIFNSFTHSFIYLFKNITVTLKEELAAFRIADMIRIVGVKSHCGSKLHHKSM